MNILGIDTAGRTLGIGMVCDGAPRGELVLGAPRRASALLPGLIDEFLDHLDLALGDLDAVAVTLGPGSFTGLRIGAALVAGLCHSRRVVPVGVCSTEALVCSTSVPPGSYALGALKAGRGAAFVALYRREGDPEVGGHWIPVEVTPPQRCTTDEVEDLVAEKIPPGALAVWVADSDEVLPAVCGSAYGVIRGISPAAVALIGWRKMMDGEVLAPEEVYPRYYRPSAAEMKREGEG